MLERVGGFRQAFERHSLGWGGGLPGPGRGGTLWSLAGVRAVEQTERQAEVAAADFVGGFGAYPISEFTRHGHPPIPHIAFAAQMGRTCAPIRSRSRTGRRIYPTRLCHHIRHWAGIRRGPARESPVPGRGIQAIPRADGQKPRTFWGPNLMSRMGQGS